MSFGQVFSIGMGAVFGALLRWGFGICLNPVFPTLPLGTLAVNLLGGMLMGAMVFLTTEHAFFTKDVRLALITGFLGSLTTFSTFSAEAFVLLSKFEFFYFFTLIVLHVGGSVAMVFIGYSAVKALLN